MGDGVWDEAQPPAALLADVYPVLAPRLAPCPLAGEVHYADKVMALLPQLEQLDPEEDEEDDDDEDDEARPAFPPAACAFLPLLTCCCRLAG